MTGVIRLSALMKSMNARSGGGKQDAADEAELRQAMEARPVGGDPAQDAERDKRAGHERGDVSRARRVGCFRGVEGHHNRSR